MLIVTVSTATAFLTSVLLLLFGIHSMAIRYGTAAIAGYAAFVLLLRAWVRWKWSRVKLNADGSDLVDVAANAIDVPLDLPLPRGAGRFGGGGGRSGGGGASGMWGSTAQTAASPAKSSAGSTGSGQGGGWGLDFDADDLFWVIVAVVAAFAGIVAVGYVIWIAPTLLAEAIVNGAIAGQVYRGMRKHEDDFWTSQIFRRTIVSGVVVVLCAVAAGYAFNRIAPEARSIGAVWAQLQAK
jgi:hypothetical protein